MIKSRHYITNKSNGRIVSESKSKIIKSFISRPILNKVQPDFGKLNQTVSNRGFYARMESITVQNNQGSTGF